MPTYAYDTLVTGACLYHSWNWHDVQVVALAWFIISYVPGGQTGMRLWKYFMTAVFCVTVLWSDFSNLLFWDEYSMKGTLTCDFSRYCFQFFSRPMQVGTEAQATNFLFSYKKTSGSLLINGTIMVPVSNWKYVNIIKNLILGSFFIVKE
jgi:hypothetical protein